MSLSKVTPLRLLLKELQCLYSVCLSGVGGGRHALAVRLPGTPFVSRTDHSFLLYNVETFILVVPKVPNMFHLNAIKRK
jgi:hypothetical protein